MSEVMARPSSALATFETTNLAAVFMQPGGIEDIVSRIEADVRSQAQTLDISTEKGRKAIASLRYKVARSKTAMDDAGKTLNESKRAEINAVDADRRAMRDRLDALGTEIGKPLDDYKAAEAARIKANEEWVATMESLAVGLADLTPVQILERRRQLAIVAEANWSPEFVVRAERVQAGVFAQLEVAHQAAVKREEEAAEQARIRAAEADRQRKEAHQTAIQSIRNFAIIPYGDPLTAADFRIKLDRLDNLPAHDFEEFSDEASGAISTVRADLQKMLDAAVKREDEERKAREAQIAAEAAEQARRATEEQAERDRQAAEAEAERKRLAAEAQAKAQQEAAERREREARDAAAKAEADRKAAVARAEREKQEAAAQAERDRQAAEQRAQQEREAAARREREALEAAQRAETARKEAEARAERERIAAAERAEREKAAAVEAERQRQAAEAERVRQEDAKRAADLEHRRTINNEAVADLIAAGVSKTAAIEAVKAIALGKVRHINVRY